MPKRTLHRHHITARIDEPGGEKVAAIVESVRDTHRIPDDAPGPRHGDRVGGQAGVAAAREEVSVRIVTRPVQPHVLGQDLHETMRDVDGSLAPQRIGPYRSGLGRTSIALSGCATTLLRTLADGCGSVRYVRRLGFESLRAHCRSASRAWADSLPGSA